MTKNVSSFDGTNIYYEYLPNKLLNKFIVLLHGLGGDSAAWKYEKEKLLQKGYSAIIPDLRGHGLSGRPENPEAYNLENFAKDILEILKKENVKNPLIVGHCFGGMVSMVLEGQFHISKGQVLVDTSYKAPYISEKLAQSRFIHSMIDLLASHAPHLHVNEHVDYSKFIHTADFDFRRLLSDILHTSLRSYLMICEKMVGFNALQLLDRIMSPTLIVAGTKDSIFPPDIAVYLHKRIKKSKIDFVLEANHIIILNNPKSVIDDIDKFSHYIGL